MGLDQVLVITDEVDENLDLSSRNLPNVLVLDGAAGRPGVAGAARRTCCSRARRVAKLEEMFT